jgi:uncharacterized protein (DUF1778 family)
MGKTEMMRLRLQPEEKMTFEHAAELAGLPLSAWVRERLRRAARIELEDAGERVAFAKLRRGEDQ